MELSWILPFKTLNELWKGSLSPSGDRLIDKFHNRIILVLERNIFPKFDKDPLIPEVVNIFQNYGITEGNYLRLTESAIMRLLEDIEETVSPTKHNSAPPFSKIPPPPPDSQFSIDPVEESNNDAFRLGYDSLLVDRDFEIIVKSDLQKRMIDCLRQ